MAELKTKVTNEDAYEFLNRVALEDRKKDGLIIAKMMEEIVGEPPKMWGTSIVGFGMYHYKSERSRQEGDWPLIGFSPRKQNLTIYLMDRDNEMEQLLKKLGKHKSTKGCVYIKTLKEVNVDILIELIRRGYERMKGRYNN